MISVIIKSFWRVLRSFCFNGKKIIAVQEPLQGKVANIWHYFHSIPLSCMKKVSLKNASESSTWHQIGRKVFSACPHVLFERPHLYQSYIPSATFWHVFVQSGMFLRSGESGQKMWWSFPEGTQFARSVGTLHCKCFDHKDYRTGNCRGPAGKIYTIQSRELLTI